MVAIVGVNGSGKSTATKLFNRLYDVTEGQILIDGLPIALYKAKEVRRAIAILRQEHSKYPLNLRLNVALGSPDQIETIDEEIHQALEAGGANAFIEKLPRGLDTIVSPLMGQSGLCQRGGFELEYELIDQLKMMQKDQDLSLSGGESQRLAA